MPSSEGRPYCWARDILVRRLEDRVLLLPLEADSVVALRGSAADLWEFLAEPATAEEAIAALASAYTTDGGVVRDALLPVFARLVELGAVE